MFLQVEIFRIRQGLFDRYAKLIFPGIIFLYINGYPSLIYSFLIDADFVHSDVKICARVCHIGEKIHRMG